MDAPFVQVKERISHRSSIKRRPNVFFCFVCVCVMKGCGKSRIR
jgi:hypothetical protein